MPQAHPYSGLLHPSAELQAADSSARRPQGQGQWVYSQHRTCVQGAHAPASHSTVHDPSSHARGQHFRCLPPHHAQRSRCAPHCTAPTHHATYRLPWQPLPQLCLSLPAAVTSCTCTQGALLAHFPRTARPCASTAPRQCGCSASSRAASRSCPCAWGSPACSGRAGHTPSTHLVRAPEQRGMRCPCSWAGRSHRRGS
jgi:hypothetical protein